MKKLLTAFVLCTMAAAIDAEARISTIENYWRDEDPYNMMVSLAERCEKNPSLSECGGLRKNNRGRRGSVTCEDEGYLSAVPDENQECTTIRRNKRTCYTNCRCKSSFQYTCNGNGQTPGPVQCGGRFESCGCNSQYSTCQTPKVGDPDDKCTTLVKVGSGASSQTLYSMCNCPAQYSKTCNGAGEQGNGQTCDNKYTSCSCQSGYRYPKSNEEGVGTPCTADGGYKYNNFNTVTPRNDEVANDCSNASGMYGNLFDGKTYSEKGFYLYSNAVGNKDIVLYTFQAFYSIVNDDHEFFGRTKWYIPAVGEALAINTVDPKKLVKASDFLSQVANEAKTHTAPGNSEFSSIAKVPSELRFESDVSDFLKTTYDKVASKLGMPVIFKGPIATSSEINNVNYYAVNGVQIVSANKGEYAKSPVRVFPVTRVPVGALHGDIKIGSVVGADMAAETFGGGLVPADKIVGIIYYIAGDQALIVSAYPQYYNDKYSVQPTKIGKGSDVTYKWARNDINIFPADVRDPWTCGINAAQNYVDQGGGQGGGNGMDCDNDFDYFEGPLFDGRENTDNILQQAEEYDGTYMATQARGAKDFQGNYGVNFKWHLPAIGELMQLFGCDMEKVANDLQQNPDKADVADHGELGPLVGEYCVENRTEVFDRVDIAIAEADKYIRVVKLDDVIAPTSTSSESLCGGDENPEPCILAMDPKGAGYISRDAKMVVRPVALLEGDYKEAKVGDFVNTKGDYSSNIADFKKDVVGVIFWVHPDGKAVRIVSLINLSVKSEDGDGVTYFAYYDDSKDPTPIYWGKMIDYKQVVDRPFSCKVHYEGLGNNGLGYGLGNSCNNFKELNGPLFDGEGNNKRIINAFPDVETLAHKIRGYGANGVYAGMALGEGKWYLPAWGEVLEMLGTDWGCVLDHADELNNALANLDEGEFGVVNECISHESPAIKASNILHGRYSDFFLPLDNKPVTSTELSDGEGYIQGHYNFASKAQDYDVIYPATIVRPTDKFAKDIFKNIIEGIGRKPEVGDIMMYDGAYTNADDYSGDPNKIAGIIYWVSPDGYTVRVVNPLKSDWSNWGPDGLAGTGVQVAECGQNGGSNSGNYSSGCNLDYYRYTKEDCNSLRSVSGEVCEDDQGINHYTQCVCNTGTPSTNGQLVGCLAAPDEVLGKVNTQKMADNGSPAGLYANSYHPSAVDVNDSLFGAGHWFIDAMNESAFHFYPSRNMGNGSPWNTLVESKCVNSVQNNLYRWTSCEHSYDYASQTWCYNKDNLSMCGKNSNAPVVRPVTFVKCQSYQSDNGVDPTGKILYADMTYGIVEGYKKNAPVIGYITSYSNGVVSIISFDTGNTYWGLAGTRLGNSCGN